MTITFTERLFLTHETNKELETSLKTLKEELLEEISMSSTSKDHELQVSILFVFGVSSLKFLE
jgi:hypothetical protein